MANQFLTFMAPDDEHAFVRFLERYMFHVYPRRISADWQPFRASIENLPRFPAQEAYLVASDIGTLLTDIIKRGPDKGCLRVDERRSPVIFWKRSQIVDDGICLSGELWAEGDLTPQAGRRYSTAPLFRRRLNEIFHWLTRTFHKSRPKGYLLGPTITRMVKAGHVRLRENRHRGRHITVY